jgi:hypothetical protein
VAEIQAPFKDWLMISRTLTISLPLACSISILATIDAAPPAGLERPPDPIHEQTVYIPYARLREVFEREGRGVFLPYEEFERLWRAALDATPLPEILHPPVATLVTEADHEAIVTQDVVRVTARVHIEVLTEGWHEIPLGLADAAITAAHIDGRPARLVYAPESGYALLVDNSSTEPQHIELVLEYAKAYIKAPGRNSVSFTAPQAPVSRWRMTIPEGGVKVDFDPLIAATEVPSGSSGSAPAARTSDPSGAAGSAAPPEPSSDGDQTVVLAFVGAAPSVRIDWRPRAEGAKDLQALASATCEQRVWIGDGVVRTQVRMDYAISRADLTELAIDAPLDHRVVEVADANVRQWTVQEEGNRQRITVQLFEPARALQRLRLEFEKPLENVPRTELLIPAIAASGVSRQQGVIAIEVAAGHRAEALVHAGLLRLDAGELPPDLAGKPWALTYRYATMPFELQVAIERLQPRMVSDSLLRVTLQPDALHVRQVTLYEVERAGVFHLDVEVPDEYDILQVRGIGAAGAQPVVVDSHERGVEDRRLLRVNLARQAIGKVGLALELSRRLTHPELAQPLGRAARIDLALPRVAAAGLERRSGRVLLYAPEALRVNPGPVQGLRSVSFAEAQAGFGEDGDGAAGLRPVLAYVHAGEAAQLPLDVERRKPQITVRQLLNVDIETAAVKCAALFTYDIRYSGVKRLRIDVPAELAERIRVETPDIREEQIEPQPSDVAAGYVAWQLVGQEEFTGEARVKLVWDTALTPLDVGDTVSIPLPRLQPREVDRSWGQVVLRKGEALDVDAEGQARGVRPIDPQHDLMAGADAAGAPRAFEFQEDWALTISATHYALQAIKTTSIERALLRMVVTRSDEITVQALYQLRSRRQRLAVQLPAGAAFDIDPLRINGQPVALERGEKGDYSVPLSGVAGSPAPFLIELRYTLPAAQARLDGPVFPEEPAVQQVYVCAYVPAERAFLGATGPWTDELSWPWISPWERQPVSMRGERQLLEWVTHGLPISGDPVAPFQTDGRLYVFSALRPLPPPAGTLRLWTLHEDLLRFGVMAALVAGGVLLLRRRAATRFFAVAGLIVLLVLLGSFMPTFSRQVLNAHLLAAACIVVTVWAVQYYAFIRPHDPVVAARRQAREAAHLALLKSSSVNPQARAGPPAPPINPPPSGAESTSDPIDHDPDQKGGPRHAS